MADVTIWYEGSTIAELNASGTKTLSTSGKYCEGDIVVEYAKPEAEAEETANVKRWDITVSNGVPSSGAFLTLLTDPWLAANRSNPNLCVLILPKFIIPYSSTVRNQGLYLGTNMPLMTDSANVLYKSLSAYVHTNGSILARTRKYDLTGANDVGDIDITTNGTLRAVSTSAAPVVPGEYVVFAFIV